MKITADVSKTINFAMQQNYVPVVRSVFISNDTDEDIENLKLRISFSPEFAAVSETEIRCINAGSSAEISAVKILLSTEFLFSLTEKMLGTVSIGVYREETLLVSQEEQIELLAYNQWTGYNIMPEIVSAFVTPNQPLISRVIGRASCILSDWTGRPEFTGYQTQNANHVKLQMAAIFASLQSEGIIYNAPPASFESTGQRVRMSNECLEQKMGTCLDLTLLYASCLEAVGLYPLIVFMKSHAFAGCHLEKEPFADCVSDDISALEKRTAYMAEEILLTECTDFVSGSSADFENSIAHGNANLSRLDEFVCFVDVKRCRISDIRPIPTCIEQAAEGCTVKSSIGFNVPVRDSYAPPEMLDESFKGIVVHEDVHGQAVSKEKVWERKLLDFSMRNALLNYRSRKNMVSLLCSNPGKIEDMLAEGHDLRILPCPEELESVYRDIKMYEMDNNIELIRDIADSQLENKRVYSNLKKAELDKTLKSLYRSAKVSMEENGCNTLFLALGFLRWYETEKSEKARYAPLVMIPVNIVRSIKNGGYVIRSRQEEAQVNFTLLEYLKQDYGIKIGGLDPLPMDESGINLPLIFHIIRQAVMAKNMWNVENLAVLGLFSFGQFVMWNDIRNRTEELKQNKVVASLMKGSLTWKPEEHVLTAEELDKRISPADMAVPVSADSSQLAAIAAAADGQSFVLHGPPGTGKSQTITNMIANSLYNGKSVLFVAEKMAALNVVYKRLEAVGLGNFCLELHSNKSSKSSVLSQLDKALETGRLALPAEYEAAAGKLHGLRKELGYLVEAIHEKREYGCSLYEAVEQYELNSEYKGKISISEELLSKASEETISEWTELIEKYSAAAEEAGGVPENPLEGVETLNYSLETRGQFVGSLEKIISSLENADESIRWLTERFGCKTERDSEGIKLLLFMAGTAAESGEVLSGLVLSENGSAIQKSMSDLSDTGKELNRLRTEALDRFIAQVTDYNAGNAYIEWKKAEESWFIPKMAKQSSLLKELKAYAKAPDEISKDNIAECYTLLMEFTEHRDAVRNASAQAEAMLGGLFEGFGTDWQRVDEALKKAGSMLTIKKYLTEEAFAAYIKAVGKAQNEEALVFHRDRLSGFVASVDEFIAEYCVNSEVFHISEAYTDSLRQVLESYRKNAGLLKNRVVLNQRILSMNESGLKAVCDACESGVVSTGEALKAFLGNLYYRIVLSTISADPKLASFSGNEQEDEIGRYSELIDRFSELTKQELAAKLSANIPSGHDEETPDSELVILKKAIKNNGRMLTIRKLFDQIPLLLRRLCPCMLMSPISVAQYIDPSFPKFDVVIFDEASQLPTSEAVGTIARGENVVVVGDPKQLPPTSFFTSNKIDEEDCENEDLESLLDDCLAISMPQQHLKWHYRSKHESLIAYSNMKYYDNKLYTFPSPNSMMSKVTMEYVSGVYDKGRTKQNRAEAEAVVAEIVRRLADEELRKDSIGVVTFSVVQQNLIDDLLSEEFAKNPELHEIDEGAKEPIFIKNLENVQGDERDVILFSVGYGPDKEGRVSMNFGPLNREGGWRRLNVAVSRARKEMKVYSSVRPEQIDLGRTRSEGIAGLKGFLEFAAQGRNSVPGSGTSEMQRDEIVNDVFRQLSEMGYKVRKNVGCSQYRMDLAVVHPDEPDSFILGIMLDGHNANQSFTLRDRYVLQPGVLKGLGWNIIRIWMLDWLDNPEQVKKNLRGVLENLMNGGKQQNGKKAAEQ